MKRVEKLTTQATGKILMIGVCMFLVTVGRGGIVDC